MNSSLVLVGQLYCFL